MIAQDGESVIADSVIFVRNPACNNYHGTSLCECLLLALLDHNMCGNLKAFTCKLHGLGADCPDPSLSP